MKYICKKCKHEFEKKSDKAFKSCPKCGALAKAQGKYSGRTTIIPRGFGFK